MVWVGGLHGKDTCPAVVGCKIVRVLQLIVACALPTGNIRQAANRNRFKPF